MSNIINTKKPFSGILSRLALAALLPLTPLFFLPIFGVSLAAAKSGFVLLTLAFALSAYMLARASDRTFSTPSTSAILVIAALPVTFFISAVANTRFSSSFIGNTLESTTVLFIILMAIVAFLSSVYLRSDKEIESSLRLVFISFGIVAAYQVLRLAVTLITQNASSAALSFGMFPGTYGNLLDKWNDIAIFSGLVMLAIIVAWRTLNKKSKILAGITFVVAGFIAKVVAFSMLWVVLAVLLLAYVILDSVADKKVTIFSRKGLTPFRAVVSVMAIGMILFSVLGAYGARLNSKGQIMHPTVYKAVNLAPNLFGGVPSEIRPGFASTYLVFKDTIRNNPIFGKGPNKFSESWVQYRPLEINQTPYGDTDFNYAVGYIPTLMISTGILGSIALIVFFLYFLKQAISLAISKKSTATEKVVAYSGIYLVVLSFFYIPAVALIIYMFAVAGIIFAKSGVSEKVLSDTKLNKNIIRAISLISIAFFVLVCFQLIKQHNAARNYSLAVYAVQVDKNIDSAEKYLAKALAGHPIDLYYRGYAELSSLKASVIASQNTKGGVLSEEARASAQENYLQAEKYADQAILANPKNYVNYLFAARIYEADPSKLDKSEELYNKALTYSPSNPNVYFGIAKIKANQGDIEGVKSNLQKAIEIRPGYTEALLAGAQLKASEKDIKGSLDFLVQAYRSNNSRLDLLLIIADVQEKEQNDIKAATETLEYAVGNNPSYAEGRLALATIYAKQAKYVDAANLLVGIKTEDENTKKILDQYILELKAGKNPFKTNQAPNGAASSKATTTATSTKSKK